MTSDAHRPNYFLVFLSIGASVFLSKGAAILLIFLVALVKAVLVLLNYMHLKFERPLLYALIIVPLLIVAVLVFALFPDFVFHH